MAYSKSDNEVHEMSAAVASRYAQEMVRREARGPGDLDNALDRLEARYGIGRWQLAHLRSGRSKTVSAGLFQRIRAAYLDYCERQVRSLQHEIMIEKAAGHDLDADLLAEAEALLAKIEKRKRA